MKTRSRVLPVAMAAAMAIGAGGLAFAATDMTEDAREISAINEAKVSLSEAVTTAEQHVGGKALEAEFESEDGKALFEVKVAKDNSIYEVKIDSDTGEVVSTKKDD